MFSWWVFLGEVENGEEPINTRTENRMAYNTMYYDNGPVRTKTTFRNGKELKSEEFAKLDDPQPHVRIEIEANARLYEVSKHPLLDI